MFGALLVALGLAHTLAGTWASTETSPWLVTPLWTLALAGLGAGGLGALGARPLDRIWWPLAAVGAAGGLALVTLTRDRGFVLLLVIDLAVLAALVRRGARPAIAVERASRAPRRHPRIGTLCDIAAFAFAAYLVVITALHPWYAAWGTSRAERAAPLAGDALVPVAHYRIDHAVTIQAPADAVWPWVVQLGQDRAGFYSYDWLERFIGDDVRNADRVHPEWQQRAVGDLVRATQAGYLGGILGDSVGWRIVALEPGRLLYLKDWGAFVVVPVNERTSRLYVRTRGSAAPTPANTLFSPLGSSCQRVCNRRQAARSFRVLAMTSTPSR